MTRFVIDASAAAEYLLKTSLGLAVADIVEDASLVAPEMIDAEVMSVLRRAVLHGHLEEARARMAMEDLVVWPVERIPHRPLVPLAWRYYRSITAYDALYVATARLYGVPLITSDGRLARASGLDIAVQNLGVG